MEPNVGIIKQINIEKFRHLENVEISLGSKITVIAGGNGTGKTSILGLLSHVFTYSEKGLNGNPMTSKFSEVFRFSENTIRVASIHTILGLKMAPTKTLYQE